MAANGLDVNQLQLALKKEELLMAQEQKDKYQKELEEKVRDLEEQVKLNEGVYEEKLRLQRLVWNTESKSYVEQIHELKQKLDQLNNVQPIAVNVETDTKLVQTDDPQSERVETKNALEKDLEKITEELASREKLITTLQSEINSKMSSDQSLSQIQADQSLETQRRREAEEALSQEQAQHKLFAEEMKKQLEHSIQERAEFYLDMVANEKRMAAEVEAARAELEEAKRLFNEKQREAQMYKERKAKEINLLKNELTETETLLHNHKKDSRNEIAKLERHSAALEEEVKKEKDAYNQLLQEKKTFEEMITQKVMKEQEEKQKLKVAMEMVQTNTEIFENQLKFVVDKSIEEFNVDNVMKKMTDKLTSTNTRLEKLVVQKNAIQKLVTAKVALEEKLKQQDEKHATELQALRDEMDMDAEYLRNQAQNNQEEIADLYDKLEEARSNTKPIVETVTIEVQTTEDLSLLEKKLKEAAADVEREKIVSKVAQDSLKMATDKQAKLEQEVKRANTESTEFESQNKQMKDQIAQLNNTITQLLQQSEAKDLVILNLKKQTADNSAIRTYMKKLEEQNEKLLAKGEEINGDTEALRILTTRIIDENEQLKKKQYENRNLFREMKEENSKLRERLKEESATARPETKRRIET
jgi:hypothetical protein